MLKLSGAALLLSAFGMQTRQNTEAAISLQRTQAAELDSRTRQKAIGYETLYFAARAAGVDRPEYLKGAAQQYYVGTMGMMVTAPGDKQTIARTIRQLEQDANAVHDEDSFHQFLAEQDDVKARNGKAELQGLIEPETNAKSLGFFYLILYGIGSIVALIGQALD